MSIPNKLIRSISFEMLYPAEGDGSILEVLDDDGNCFAQVTIDENDERQITFFDTPIGLTLQLSQLEAALTKAKAEVVNTDPDALFGEG